MRRARFVCLFFALLASACSRCSSEHEGAPVSESAAPSAQAREPPPEPKLLPLTPPVTPDVPPELVACGERDFYRISQGLLEVFESALELPPPQIRGSRVARKIDEVAIEAPLNVFSPAKKSALVIAKESVVRYELGQPGARRYAPISAKSPLVAWPDPQRADSFRVHAAGEAKLRHYRLGRLPKADAARPEAK